IEFRAVGRFAAFNLVAAHPSPRASRRFRARAAFPLIAFTHALRQACGFICIIETPADRANAAHGSACQGIAGEEQNKNKRGDTSRHDSLENTRARLAVSTSPACMGVPTRFVEDVNKYTSGTKISGV